MKSTVIRLLVCLGMLLFWTGCSTENGRRDESQSGETSFESPSDETSFESPFESPIAPTATPRPSCLTLIEPVGNTVCGYVVSQSSGMPIARRPVFLAEGLFASDNSVVLAALDQETAPQGVTDENGMFYVVDVPSNLYFLMVGDYPQPVMLHEPDNPINDLFVDWRDSEGAVDLGVIPTHILVSQEP